MPTDLVVAGIAFLSDDQVTLRPICLAKALLEPIAKAEVVLCGIEDHRALVDVRECVVRPENRQFAEVARHRRDEGALGRLVVAQEVLLHVLAQRLNAI